MTAQQDDWNSPTTKTQPRPMQEIKNRSKNDKKQTKDVATVQQKHQNYRHLHTTIRSHGHQTRNEIHQIGTTHSERAVSCKNDPSSTTLMGHQCADRNLGPHSPKLLEYI